MIQRALLIYLCLVAGKALALTAAPEKLWQPDPALVQKLAQTKAEDIEVSFGRSVPEGERLPYATAMASLSFWQLKDEQRTEKYLNLARAELHGVEPEKYAGEVYLLLMLLAERRNDLDALKKIRQQHRARDQQGRANPARHSRDHSSTALAGRIQDRRLPRGGEVGSPHGA